MLQCNRTKNDESTFFILNIYISVFLCGIFLGVLPYMNENAKHTAESILMLYNHFPLSFSDTSGAS